MELDHVYALREKMRKTLSPFGFGFAESMFDVSFGVAFGATPKQYKLAVRLRGLGPLQFALKWKIESIAGKAELDILTGHSVRPIGGCPAHGTKNTAPLGIGASLGVRDAIGGTAGFFARRVSDEKLGVVSANHVIALADKAKNEAEIVHPSLCDGAQKTIARLDGSYPLLSSGGEKEVDCAFAVLSDDAAPNLSSLGTDGTLLDTPADPKDNVLVRKIGRTTKRREGRIRAFDFDKLVVRDYPFGNADFENQIEIESPLDVRFSRPGDSGSCVYNADRQPVGLLFAEAVTDSTHKVALHYASPMSAVLKALKVTIAV